MNTSQPWAVRFPLLLLVQVNLLAAWRRLKGVRNQSRLLTAVIGLFIAGYLVLAFWLFVAGLRFVSQFPGLGSVLTERLLYLLFAFLFGLLLLSNLVINYTNLFRNRETTFLLSLPIRRQTVFQWKFIESMLLASWAFIFLIAPLLAAYGLTRGVPWHFYPFTILQIGLFIILPAVAGSFLAIILARYLDRKLFQVVGLTVLAVLLVGAAWWFRPAPPTEELSETRVMAVLDKLLARTQFADAPFLPSRWLSASVLYWAEGATRSAVFYMLVLLSYALFFGYVASTAMGGLFYEGVSAVHSRASVFGRWQWLRRQRKPELHLAPGLADRLMAWFGWLDRDVRALIVKDSRMFWRDTSQWGQSLMLFGLLAVYIFNLRQFSQQLLNPFWVHLVSFLNLGACSLNLATLTTRFVYPQFSLEGKRLWIVGMAPLGMVRILKTKFWMAALGALTVTLGLMVLSCHMLKLPWYRTLYFAGAVTVMTFALTALAVGLGALYPNFKEDNPSKIVSGFGGTFCLVLSFLYILGSVLLLALAARWGGPAQGPLWTPICSAAFLLISCLLGWLPWRLGLRRVRDFEL